MAAPGVARMADDMHGMVERVAGEPGCRLPQAHAGPCSTAAWIVRMDRYRSTWYWFTTNPQGGGFGSNHCGTRRVALGDAVRNIPVGTPYDLIINGRLTPAVRS